MTEAIQKLRNKIENYLIRKKWNYSVGSDGQYILYEGSTRVEIFARDWGNNTLVLITAPVSIDAYEINTDLLYALLCKNYDVVLGKFSLDKKNSMILFEHSLLGNTLDSEEFYLAVETAAIVADNYDESIAELSKGKRVIDEA